MGGLNTTTDMLLVGEPRSEILAQIPEELRTDEQVLRRVGDMAFWVNDGRTTAQKASKLILDSLGRSVA